MKLTRERVLQAAMDMADRDGLATLSMRRLGEQLGAGAMSLYHYVPNKDDLIGGMVDLVFAEIDPPEPGGDWRAEMRKRARSTRAALNRHRWAVGLMENHQAGPASTRLHDRVLGCLREAGFTLDQTVQAYSVLDAYLYGFALQESTLSFETAEEVKAIAASQGWDEMAAEYPYLAEVVSGHVAKVGYDFAGSFEYGLELILDALDHRRE